MKKSKSNFRVDIKISIKVGKKRENENSRAKIITFLNTSTHLVFMRAIFYEYFLIISSKWS